MNTQSQELRFAGMTNSYAGFTNAIQSYGRMQDQVRIEVRRACSRWPWLRKLSCIELGSGTGATTRQILDADEGICITAVDNDPDMRRILEKKIEEWNAKERVTIVEQDILTYLQTVPDHSVHFVVTAFALHNIERTLRDRIIREIFRVLEGGGLFLNADKYARDAADEHAHAYKRQIVDFELFELHNKTGDLQKWIEHYERDEQADLIFFETPAKEFMKELGFERVLTVYRENMEAVIVGRKP